MGRIRYTLKKLNKYKLIIFLMVAKTSPFPNESLIAVLIKPHVVIICATFPHFGG